MKTILAPTDFSKNSRNAVYYAAEIAIRLKANLVLLHAYLPPIILSEVPVIVPVPDEIEKNAMKTLKRLATNLRLKHGKKIQVELKCEYGLAVDVILDYANTHQVGLIVMGMQGLGFLQEKLVGCITTDMIKKSKVPVLSVNEHLKFKNIKNIALATDYLELSHATVLNPLKEIARLFKSHIYVLNVVQENKSIPEVSQAAEGLKIAHVLEEFDHSFHFIVSKKIAEGINQFVDTRQIDLVVMIPRKHLYVKTIFKGRESKKVAFHSNASLLTLHE